MIFSPAMFKPFLICIVKETDFEKHTRE